MAASSLGRKIRRIGLLRSSYDADGSNRVHNFDSKMDTDKVELQVQILTRKARARRRDAKLNINHK